MTNAHLVGSINLPDADTVFRTVAGHLGSRLPRIPDGEVAFLKLDIVDPESIQRAASGTV